MRLVGVDVQPEDCRTLVDLLLRVGRADDLSLPAESTEVSTTTRILALSPAERKTLLGVLDDPPDSLTELAANSPATIASAAEIEPTLVRVTRRHG